MKIAYAKRWWYAAILSVAMWVSGYFYLLNPLLLQLAVLQAERKQLKQTLVDNKYVLRDAERVKQHKTNAPPLALNAVLSHLLLQLHTRGLVLQTLQQVALVTADERETLWLHLNIKGAYQPLFLFLLTLQEQAYPLQLLDFSCEKASNNQLLLAADFLLFKSTALLVKKTMPTFLLPSSQPFCSSAGLSAAVHDDNAILHAVSIRHLKMVGYISQLQQQAAFFLLPDQQVVSVPKGALLGKERARVMQIGAGEVLALLPEQKQIRFKL